MLKRSWLRPLRPYALHLSLLAYTPALLFADGLTAGVEPQLAVGLLTFAVLWAAARRVAPERRWEVWLCVPIATLFEVFGSLIWRGYTYELENIPLYVPPGHALVYVFGITAAGLPLVRSHGRRLRRLVMLLATGWVVAGLTVLPLFTGRLDVQGAVVWPLLAWCVLRSGKGDMFAAIWLAVATIEIAGTLAGAWVWTASAPWTHLPSGNPPSAIAAGYAVIDGSVALLAPLLAGLASWTTSANSPVRSSLRMSLRRPSGMRSSLITVCPSSCRRSRAMGVAVPPRQSASATGSQRPVFAEA
jgi:hypothetical protein